MKCVVDIKDSASKVGHQITDDEALEILSEFEEELSKKSGKVFSEAEEDELLDIRVSLHQRAKINAAITRRNHLINVKKAAEIQIKMAAFEAGGSGSKADALVDMLVGSNKNFQGARNSIGAQQQGIMNSIGGALLGELEKLNLVKVFQSGELDELIYKELFDGIGSSGSKEAKDIAMAMSKGQQNLLNRKNRAGASISELANYVVRQRHNPDLLRDAGPDGWLRDVWDLLDHEKTFGNMDDAGKRAYLKSAYEHLESGNFQKVTSEFGVDGNITKLSAFTGPVNLAKKLSGSRTLHFKDGASSFAYANQYSGKNLMMTLIDGFGNDAESISLMETFGTNPAAMINRTMDKFNIEGRDRVRVENALKELDGTSRAVFGNQTKSMGLTLAGTASNFRAIQNMSKLGMATISSFSDIATKAALLQREAGRGFIESYFRSIADVIQAFGDKDKLQFSYLLGTGVDGFLGSAHSRYGADDNITGMLARMQNIFFRLNGMQFWNAAQKDGVAKILAADLSNHARGNFDDIPLGTRNTLAMYDITQNDLLMLRNVDAVADDGRNYVFPEMVEQLQPSQIDAEVSRITGRTDVTQSMRQDYIDKLRTKLASYYADSADAAVPTPGARERAIMNQGLQRGTPAGEAIRLLGQFKSFPITFLGKGAKREYYGRKAAGQSGTIGVVKLVMGMTAMGYVSNATKDVLKGKSPREVFTPERARSGFIEAFTAGGGAGLYGDFLFAEYNRYGQSLAEVAGGPAVGVMGDLARVFARIRDGDFEEAGESLVRGSVRNIPYQNIYFGKAAIDYLFLYGLSEAISPGYTRRLEKRARSDKGSEYFLRPSRSPSASIARDLR